MAKKRYMIRCDIEGVSGVVSYEQAEPVKAEYAFGCRMFMADLTACVDGLIAGGADEIVIYDEHCGGHNINLGAMPACVAAICGKQPYRADWPGGLDDTFAGVVLLGFHSKYGTAGGLLHHTYELDIRDLRLNGVSVGEIGMEAAVAGDCGVPVLLVTGDSAGVAEAQKLIPGVGGVVVKESLGETSGLCYSTAMTGPAIRAACERVVKNPPSVQPYVVGGDVTLEVELNDGPYLTIVQRELKAYMTDERTLLIRGEGAAAVWSDYWHKKLHCQQQLSMESA